MDDEHCDENGVRVINRAGGVKGTQNRSQQIELCAGVLARSRSRLSEGLDPVHESTFGTGPSGRLHQ